jgi:hypothetical protein
VVTFGVVVRAAGRRARRDLRGGAAHPAREIEQVGDAFDNVLAESDDRAV